MGLQTEHTLVPPEAVVVWHPARARQAITSATLGFQGIVESP
jgi:hypothetical protein